ncbi:MAG: mannose-1-phosphate guanylyltransferase [Planctomycetales bacterium]|nr:mannose-1-phosphate guanylyltransferase [Planctomycetales bacterium]MBN8628712.1 mannose-1-phosphate guanylyltransferase [Planctomycetota bacterium]
MLHALIMAGGSGTRFWPESRRARPKQLLPLVDDRSMIRATVDRLDGVVPAERTWLAVGTSLVPAIREQLPEIADRTYVAEPVQRNTAPCIGLAALRMLADDPDAVMFVLPSDHAITDVAAFQKALKLAAALADKPRKQIVTFGIKPTYPSEGFGYIERGETLSPPQGAFKALTAELDAYSVVRFREKPKLEQAQEFLAAGTFYWNSGMFVWRADVIVDALQTHQPALLKHLETIAAAHGTPEYEAVLDREFRAAPSISIDYAVMEHAKSIIVIEAPFDWDDVGGWRSLERLRGVDEAGNTIVGKHLGLDTSDTIVRTSGNHLVVTLGLKNCLVVHTPDATLVADKNDEESIRKLVKLLEERGWTDVL